jgi:hypothetical protein
MYVRFMPKPARGGPPFEWPTPFRDFVTANPFAVLTPPNDAPMDGAMSWEPDSIDADTNGFVKAVWPIARKTWAVSRTKRKGLGPPLQRSILRAISLARWHAFLVLCQKARGLHQSVALDTYRWAFLG